MKIVIAHYDPQWKSQFENEANKLMQAIQEHDLKIEHIGSTAVVGLCAKPIIDIMIGLNAFQTADNHIPAIEKLGYSYISKYEALMPNRRFFTKDEGGQRSHHIHMVEADSDFWKRHLKFRNHLRENTEDRMAYQELKLKLAQKEWKDGNEYADAKTEFIRRIENK